MLYPSTCTYETMYPFYYIKTVNAHASNVAVDTLLAL